MCSLREKEKHTLQNGHLVTTNETSTKELKMTERKIETQIMMETEMRGQERKTRKNDYLEHETRNNDKLSCRRRQSCANAK